MWHLTSTAVERAPPSNELKTSKTASGAETAAAAAVASGRQPLSIKSLFNGIFLSDHFSWVLEPSSALMIVLSYFLLRLSETHLRSDWSVAFDLWTPNVILYWFIATSFLLFDASTGESGKRFKKRSQVAVWRIIKVVFRNHFFTIIVATSLTRRVSAWLDVKWLQSGEETVLWILFSVFMNGFIFEVIFWSGHYLEHVSPVMYSKFHLLHHTTKADISFSGYYMTLMDFCFEALFPMWACLLATIAWNLSTVALLHNVMLNFVYAATVHSGWALPGFPDPNEHWIHHTKVAPRGNGINYGGHFNLMDHVMNTHEDYKEDVKRE